MIKETVTQKALRLYPEHEVIAQGRGRYLVEGSGEFFYDVNLGVFSDESYETCNCPPARRLGDCFIRKELFGIM